MAKFFKKPTTKIQWGKVAAWTAFALILAGALAFFIATACLASQDGLTIVDEWRKMFGLLKDAEPALEEAGKAMLRIAHI